MRKILIKFRIIFITIIISLILYTLITYIIDNVINKPEILEKYNLNFINIIENHYIDSLMFIKSGINSKLLNKKSSSVIISNIDLPAKKHLLENNRFIKNFDIYEKNINTKNNYILYDNFYTFLLKFIYPGNKYKHDFYKNSKSNIIYSYRCSKNHDITGNNSALSCKIIKLKNIYGNTQDILQCNKPIVPGKNYIVNLDTGFFYLFENNNRIKKYPMIINYIDEYKMNFIDLRAGENSDRVFLVSYEIHYDKERKIYRLKEVEKLIFDCFKDSIYPEANISMNDLDLMKARIEKYKTDFQLEVDLMRAKIKDNNIKLAGSINKHLRYSKIPEEWKKEIFYALLEEEYIVNIDELIAYIIIKFTELSKENDKWKNEIKFYKKLYKKCIIINKDPDNLSIKYDNRKITLHDLLFNRKNIYFDKVILKNDNFIISSLLLTFLKFIKTDPENIEFHPGKMILIKKPGINTVQEQVYKIPIDRAGNILINYSDKLDTYDFLNILNKKTFLDNKFKNKVILTGDDRINTSGLLRTPAGSLTHLEVTGAALNTIIAKKFILKISYYLEILIFLVLALITRKISGMNNIFLSIFFIFLLIFIYYLSCLASLFTANFLLNFSKPIILCIFLFIIFHIMNFYSKSTSNNKE